MTEVVHEQLLIGGKWVDAADEFPVFNPARPDEIVGYAPLGTAAHAHAAVEAAREAQPDWAATPIEERAARLSEASERSYEGLPDRAELLSRENGKVRWEAEADCGGFALFTDYCVEAGRDALTAEVISDETSRIEISRRPIGVVAAISSWNWPVGLMSAKFGPALLAGNTIVIKPPTACPLAVIDTIRQVAACFPPGVVNVVTGSASQVGTVLTTSPHINKIGFTGGTQTGISLLNSLPDIKRVTLELGGNDAAIVLDDADLDEDYVRNLAVGALTTSGQVCFAIKRVYVHRSLFHDFCELLTTVVGEHVVGEGLRESVTLGPLISTEAVQFVRALVEEARTAGSEVREVGHIDDEAVFSAGHFLRPSIVIGPDQRSPIVQEEQFGPALPVLPFHSDDEAVALANDTRYGLCSSVWSSDVERAFELARRLDAGQTFINGHSFFSVDLRAPFGGHKQSGIGREMGILGLQEYSEPHAAIHRLL
ncbi:MAG: aldehyde dehydrogenase family protein [Actinomycetota bacterium]